MVTEKAKLLDLTPGNGYQKRSSLYRAGKNVPELRGKRSDLAFKPFSPFSRGISADVHTREQSKAPHEIEKGEDYTRMGSGSYRRRVRGGYSRRRDFI